MLIIKYNISSFNPYNLISIIDFSIVQMWKLSPGGTRLRLRKVSRRARTLTGLPASGPKHKCLSRDTEDEFPHLWINSLESVFNIIVIECHPDTQFGLTTFPIWHVKWHFSNGNHLVVVGERLANSIFWAMFLIYNMKELN